MDFSPITKGTSSMTATIPTSLAGAGTVYAVVSKSATTAGDEDVVAGPAILEFPVDSASLPPPHWY